LPKNVIDAGFVSDDKDENALKQEEPKDVTDAEIISDAKDEHS
jgi:hypothetical protein